MAITAPPGTLRRHVQIILDHFLIYHKTRRRLILSGRQEDLEQAIMQAFAEELFKMAESYVKRENDNV